MSRGIIGRKQGMMRLFDEEGGMIPVTVIETTPNRVTQVKSVERDGYRAIQVAAGHQYPQRLTKSLAGHYRKAGVEPGRGLWEFRLDNENNDPAVGSEVKLEECFSVGQKVDIVGRTIGKGFAGTVKRYHFHMQDATHGNSLSHRAPGSIGQRQTPGRVFKGKRMSGHMGDVQCCVQNLEVVRVDSERNLLLVKGAVPGAKGGDLVIYPAVKVKAKK